MLFVNPMVVCAPLHQQFFRSYGYFNRDLVRNILFAEGQVFCYNQFLTAACSFGRRERVSSDGLLLAEPISPKKTKLVGQLPDTLEPRTRTVALLFFFAEGVGFGFTSRYPYIHSNTTTYRIHQSDKHIFLCHSIKQILICLYLGQIYCRLYNTAHLTSLSLLHYLLL